MKTGIMAALTGVFCLAVIAGIGRAQSVPQLINYQGRLTDSAGQPLADGSTVDLAFAFYGVQSGATPLYLTVVQHNVVVSGGIYNVLIGSGAITPGAESGLAAVFQKHAEVWMGVKVDMDAEMAPRAGITSVPYALAMDQSFLAAFMGEFTSTPDYDGDGFLKTGAPADCNDWTAAIHPGAAEVCGDGYDNDCDGYIDGSDSECCTDADLDLFFAQSGCGTTVDCDDQDHSICQAAIKELRGG